MNQHSYVFVNGEFVSEDIPVIYANDRGFLLGDGLFETIKAMHGQLLFFKEHYQRLLDSANLLGIPLLFDQDALQTHCQELLIRHQLNDDIAAIRMTLTRGCGPRGVSIAENASPTLVIVAKSYPEFLVKPCIRTCITSIHRNEYSFLTRLKTTQYLDSIMARNMAEEKGFDEGIMVNTKGLLTESSVANIFFIRNDTVITPPITDGVLPGIVRHIVFKICQTLKISLEERSVSQDEVCLVSAGFQTNSLIGIQPMISVDSHIFPDITQNDILQNIIRSYADYCT